MMLVFSCRKEKRRFLYFVSFAAIFVLGWLMFLLDDALAPVLQSYSMPAQLSHWEYLRFHNGTGESAGSFQNRTLLHYQVENVTADELFRRVRILCFVLTMPSSHKTKAKAVKETWGRRCQKLIFISTEEDKSLGAIAINITEDRNHLWKKTKEAYKYTWKHFHNETDWFLKTDDDTYMIMENLRYLLSPYNPDDPLWFGHRFKKYSKQGYMSGGAGYVLSREAVRRFIYKAIPNSKICRLDAGGAEDAELGKCLDKVGVVAIDSRDVKERERFHPFIPEHHLIPGALGNLSWYWEYAYYLPKMGLQCCSDTTISFHYITPNKMHEMEYFIYHLTPFGTPFPSLPYPPPPPSNKSTVIPIYLPESIQNKMRAGNKSRIGNITA